MYTELETAESMASMLLGMPIETWFKPINLGRLASIQRFPTAWYQIYLVAKQGRFETELVALIEDHIAMGRINPLIHWSQLPEIPDDQWLVGGLLRKGAMSILAGAPKVGKSTVVTHLVSCLLRGVDFIDRATVPCTVLYYALEEIGAEVKDRFTKYGLSDEPLYVREGHIPPTHFVDILKEDITSVEPCFVLIDPLFDILSVQSANDYQPINRALKELLAVCRETGVHITCLHHTAKGTNTILGAQSLRGATDINIFMDLTQQNERMIYSENRYGTPLAKYFVRMNDDRTLHFIDSLLE